MAPKFRISDTPQAILRKLQQLAEQAGDNAGSPSTPQAPTNNRIAIFGDSITAQCSNPTVGTEANGYLCWALRRCGQRFVFDLADNYGLGADDSVEGLARLPDVTASQAATVIVKFGSNDRGGAGLTADQTMAALTAIHDGLVAAGKTPLMVVPLPRGDSTYTSNRLSGAQLAYHLDVRRRMMAAGWAHVVDTWGVFAEPGSSTGDARLGYTYDGLHPNTTGAYHLGQVIGAALAEMLPAPAELLPVTNADVYDATLNVGGLVTVNPMMQGTGGSGSTGGSGQLADTWAGTNGTGTTGVTRTYSKVTTALRTWQQCVIGGVAATSAAAIDLARQISLHASLRVGVEYEAVGEYEIDAGSANVLSLQLGVSYTTTGGTVTLWDGDRYSTGNPLPAVAMSGTLRSPRFVAPAGLTDVRLRLTSYLDTAGAPVATVRFTTLALRPVI